MKYLIGAVVGIAVWLLLRKLVGWFFGWLGEFHV